LKRQGRKQHFRQGGSVDEGSGQCPVGNPPLFASSGEIQREPIKGELKLIYVFDGPKTEFILVIGQSGFKSANSLKRYLGSWPPGSELKWAPGCIRLGGEPLLSSEQEMKAFRAFLQKRGIKFVLVPSG
jgi:hypothetical protein